jgi:hypothetical protein
MPDSKIKPAIKLIMYLSRKNDFVTIDDILLDKLSGFKSKKNVEDALKKLFLLVEVRESEKGTSYRLAHAFDGYRGIFKIMQDSSTEIYNFLSSNYSNFMVNEIFVKEALERITRTTHFENISQSYKGPGKPGDAFLLMMSQSPGFTALAAMFRSSPLVADKLLFPEKLSKYEMSHLKIGLDLSFASDMLNRVPPGTRVSIKYEIVSQGMLNMQMRGGTEVP